MTAAASRTAVSPLRAYLDALASAGRLRRVSIPVDRAWQPGALAKWMFQAVPENERFGLFFENVIGSELPLVLGALGSSADAYALALGIERDAITAHVRSALLTMRPPVIVAEAPVHEHVALGADADLGRLPIPTFTPGKDVAPYITTTVFTRHRETGVQNIGVYRTQVLDGRRVLVNLSPGRQGWANAKTYTDAGQAAPIAWVIGPEPAVTLAAVANLKYGVDELHLAGGLQGRPVELARARSVDLMIPANAEIVIEGEVHPGETAMEGPFGEFAGYMGPVESRPIARVTAITMRPNAIYYGLVSQMPPSESTMIQSLTNSGVILKQLRDDLGETAVEDVTIDQTFGGVLAHGIVAMRPQVPGHAKRIGRLLAAMSPLKRITLVDADVDIRDPLHVEWALNSRFDPARDTVVIDDVYFPLHMDPSIRPAGGAAPQGSKLVLDATQKIDPGTFSLPPRPIMERALEVWDAAGLPPLQIPKRARLRIERS